MKKTFTIIILFLSCEGVFGDEVKSVSVMEGDSVTLHTDLTEIKTGDLVWWRFKKGDSKDLLAEIGKNKIWYTPEIFKDKLLTDGKTGDLNITNMKIKYSGLYEVEINSATGTSSKRFNITVNESPRVNNAEMIVVKSVSVTEGESVTLQTDVKLQTDDLIQWRFGDEGVLIAKGDMEDDMISLFHGTNGSFTDRLKLNDQTGDLTITDCKSEHSGVFQLKISSNKQTSYKTFSVIVREACLLSGVIAGLCVIFLLVIAAVIAAGLILYHHKISKLKLKAQENLQIQQNSVTYITHGDPQKPQKSDVDVIDEGKSVSVKGDQAVTNTVNENTQKTQNSVTAKVDKNTQKQQDSVCAADINEEMIRTGKMGVSVTLDTCVTEIKRDDEILWMFEDMTIAEYTGGTDKPTLNKTDERFKDRLEINHQTGDLTIRNMRSEHTGVYKVQIKNSSGNKERKFIVAFSVRAMMGGSVPLPTKVQIEEGDVVKWTSEDKSTLLTGMNGDDSKTSYTDDERFRDRLNMNAQTGDLTIRDIKQTDEGVYTLKLIKADRKITYRIFYVVVTGLGNTQKQQNSVDTMKGGPVSPYTESEIKRDDKVVLTSKEKNTLVTGINRDESKTSYTDDERDRQEMNPKTEDPSISDTRETDEGVSTAQLINTDGKMNVEATGAPGDILPNAANRSGWNLPLNTHHFVFKWKSKVQNKTRASLSVRAMKGGHDTPSESEIKRGDEVEQTSEDKTNLIAGINRDDSKTSYTDDERDKDRLKMNRETENPPITDTRETDEGDSTPQPNNTDGKNTDNRKNYVEVTEATNGGHDTPSESEIKKGDEVEQTSEESNLKAGINRDDSKTLHTDDKKDRQQMNAQTGDLTSTETNEKDEVYTAQLINTDVDDNDSADISNKSVAMEMKPLLEAAERSSTSPMYSSLYLPQGYQTQAGSGRRSRFYQMDKY
nr:uncharacterized protein LOC129453014 [Misgurnus anguillicaudatus]